MRRRNGCGGCGMSTARWSWRPSNPGPVLDENSVIDMRHEPEESRPRADRGFHDRRQWRDRPVPDTKRLSDTAASGQISRALEPDRGGGEAPRRRAAREADSKALGEFLTRHAKGRSAAVPRSLPHDREAHGAWHLCPECPRRGARGAFPAWPSGTTTIRPPPTGGIPT